MSCNCGFCPTVIIPGLGQSKSFEINDNGERIKSAWPLTFDTGSLKKNLAVPLAKMLITRRDAGFTEALGREIENALDTIACNPDGTPKHKIEVVRYNCPVSECSDEEKGFIYGMVPVRRLSEEIGEDHLFYFAYDIFGRISKTVDDLDEFIEYVKAKTGHDKVNLVAVSMGGAVTSFYLDRYGHKDSINRIVGIVPAFGGSVMISDLMKKNINYDGYKALFRILLGKEKGDSLSKLLSLVPDEVLNKSLDTVIESASRAVVLNSETMWSLVPACDYEELRTRFLSDDAHAQLRKITDREYEIKKDPKAFAARFPHISFFIFCGYDMPIFPVIGDGTISSDGIVHTSSASMGAFAAPTGKTLPEDYEQQAEKENCFISPDRKIDASCGAFPYSTWYFRNMQHDQSAGCERLLESAKLILTDESIKTVYDIKDHPQFS